MSSKIEGSPVGIKAAHGGWAEGVLHGHLGQRFEFLKRDTRYRGIDRRGYILHKNQSEGQFPQESLGDINSH